MAADFSNTGNVTTYRFTSLTDEHPVNGVPGLIEYCVYPSPAQPPTAITPQATGADGSDWITRQRRGSPPWLSNRELPPGNTGFGNFSFVRPRGNPSNIPLDGKSTVVGTATWSTTAPTAQTILLHIADPTVCASIYGATEDTCFVKPRPALACDIGDTTVAYNAMPFGVVNCSKPSIGVEAYNFNEFGDEVTLAAGTGRELVSLNVLFTSYGCGVSGHWYSGDCVTTPGATFDVPITANIYAGDTCNTDGCTPGTQLATVTQTFSIPYRPSADASCGHDSANPGITDGSRWFNPLANGGVGGCQYSISKVLTFTFSTGVTLPDNVVWTVAYNTSHSGYSAIGQGTTCYLADPGCGYDSLNVGTRSFTGAPYAGADVNEGVVFLSWWNGGYQPPYGGGTLELLQSTTTEVINPWTGFRPLGEIITK